MIDRLLRCFSDNCSAFSFVTKSRNRHSLIFLAKLCVTILLSIHVSVLANAQTNEWTWMAGSISNAALGTYGTLGSPAPANNPGGRSQFVTWTDSKGNLWLFGGLGLDSVGNAGYLNDLWEFSPSTNEWAWIAGTATLPSSNVGAGTYGTLGAPSAGNIPSGRMYAVTAVRL